MRNPSFASSKLLGGPSASVDADPMSSLGNLFEVMLVFAVGMMVYGFISGAQSVQLEATANVPDDLQPMEEELVEATDGVGTDGSVYAEVGTVYVDQATGEYYVVANSSDDA